MDVLRGLGQVVARSLTGLLGRRNMYRMSRFLISECRRDVPNDPDRNGELLVQTTVIRHSSPGATIMVFDVGANIGEWTGTLLAIAGQFSRQVEVHAFEPCQSTFDLLVERIQKERYPNVTAVQQACSSAPGRARLNVYGAGLGTNSITPPIHSATASQQEVELTSIDRYCELKDIRHIDLIKVDAEGHDLEVMSGARRMLHNRAVEVLQFEYNPTWIGARRYLRDAFVLLQPWGYAVGKVTPGGIEFYPRWDWELETFREGNYLACTADWLRRFKRLDPDWLTIDRLPDPRAL